MPIQVPPPSRHGLTSSHLRSRTRPSVLRSGAITQGDHLPSPEQALSEARNQVPVPQRRKSKVSEPIDLTDSSSEPESEPTPSPPPTKRSHPPAKKPQPSQTPARESQIPSGMTPEVAIRCPMVTQPPIEGNLDCKARPFHSELCFDITTFRIHPELRESFRLLQRYHREHLLTPRDFFYPRVALDFYQSMTTNQVQDPTVIHFTINGRHGASSCHYILRKELPPNMVFIDALLRHNIFPLQHWVQRRGVLLEALFRIFEGYFFGPHHLIMVALLYFEEKGAPTGPEHSEQPVDILADTQPSAPAVASSEPTLEVPPSLLKPHHSLPLLFHPHQSHLLQWQLFVLIRVDCCYSGLAYCHLEAPPFIYETMPPEEPPTGEAETVEPSSPQHPPPTN
ncbi:hypothetical protein CK203_101787 [Vitis vinifera]|uniref:Uncharacterized protein n=1 Tax=Vitis vinifera TaxID=29760 RepID=A0A438FFU0_VITVI|nr:hypothetical protein CK203_101787 [Vitis vinifera]